MPCSASIILDALLLFCQVPKSTSESTQPESEALWVMDEEGWSLEKEKRLVWFSIDWLRAGFGS